jgi:hypothetical protein
LYVRCFEGNANELYVPRSDGWLDILDASTLDLKDRVYVAGRNIASVIAHNGRLFVSSTDVSIPYVFNDNAIKIYNRADKKLLGRTGINNNTRLLLLDGLNTKLIDLTLTRIPVDLC